MVMNHLKSERAFSSAGLFVTRLRCSLGDSTIDALCLLRHYFLMREKVAKEAKELKNAEMAKKAKVADAAKKSVVNLD